VAGLVVVGLALTACGSDESAGPSAPAATPAEHDHSSHDHGDGHDHDGEPTSGAGAPQPGARRIVVTASSLAFDPAEITVNAGEDVAIVLSSVDLLHDFVIDEVDMHLGADQGKTATGGLIVMEPGEYAYYCSVEGHREAGMEGTLVVEASG
jgi:plastocyanin